MYEKYVLRKDSLHGKNSKLYFFVNTHYPAARFLVSCLAPAFHGSIPPLMKTLRHLKKNYQPL